MYVGEESLDWESVSVVGLTWDYGRHSYHC